MVEKCEYGRWAQSCPTPQSDDYKVASVLGATTPSDVYKPQSTQVEYTFLFRTRKELSTCTLCSQSLFWWLWWCALSHNIPTMVVTTMATTDTSLLIPMLITTTEPTTQLCLTSGRNR
ncbi:hypothetical protein CEXT_553121 [Caerostris extrusa]|uniref:Uncharacterized protein n=1 Tax=Caerostris extrusa TaxID=172846 RepID=A0AAV4XIQ3_CAEEX|nr:hypothetical protein CEXT_553121 [Caerostris extrusa]